MITSLTRSCRTRLPRRAGRLAGMLAACSVALSGCGGVESMVVSSLISATMKTAISQIEKNRPTPEQLWHEVQVAQMERKALAGDVEAQFQIGTYYLLLQEPVAEQWICVAANGGHPKAQLQYGHWYNEDRAREDLFPFISIAPNNAMAYMWYDLAAANGEPRAPHFRDNLIYAGMPATQLEQARARVANWSAETCSEPPLKTASTRVSAPPR